MTMRVDAAVHVWSRDPVAYPWSPHDGHELPSMPGSVEDLLADLDASATDSAVCVQPRVYGYDHGYLLHAISSHPDRLVGVGLVNPIRPSGPDELRHLVAQGIRGLRLIPLASERAEWLTDEAGDPLWDAAHSLGTPVSILCRPDQLRAVQARVARVELPVLIDHLGLVTRPSEHLHDLLALAAYDHVYVKVSALLDLAAQSSAVDVATVVGEVVSAFGTTRTMFGTDWPYALEHGSRDDAIAILARSGVDPDDAALRGGTAEALWRIGR